MRIRIACIFFTLLCLSAIQAFSQTGKWLPANADLSYPRTLLKTSEIPACRNFILSNPEVYKLYKEIYNQFLNINPVSTANGDYRREQAHYAKNGAFVYLLDRKPNGSGGLDSLTTSERILIRDKVIELMEFMNTSVDPYPAFDAYLWLSNELADQLVAYDLMKGAGVPDSSLATSRALLISYSRDLHYETDFAFLGIGFWSTKINNHAIRTAGALGLAGVILNDVGHASDVHHRASTWINTAMYHIENVMWDHSFRQSISGKLAGYAEGPHYLVFGMKHAIPLFHALGNILPDTTIAFSYDGSTKQIRHPWYDPNYELLWEWASRFRMPDGRMPPLEDSFADKGFPGLAIMEKPQYLWKMSYDKFNASQSASLSRQLRMSSDDWRPDYIAAQTLPAVTTLKHFQHMPIAGSTVFRSGWDSLAIYMHLYAQNGSARENAKGHNQADATSFIIQAYGQVLALDPGYLKWSRRGEVGEAEDHNMILVDGAGPAMAATLQGNGANAYLQNEFDLGKLDYVEANTAYQGATISRKMLFVRDRYFTGADFVTSTGTHNYEWRLHGLGIENGDSLSGYFNLDTLNHEGIWKRNEISLKAHVQSNSSYNLDVGVGGHEYTYDSLRNHSVLKATVTGEDNTQFLYGLIPFGLDTPQASSIAQSGLAVMKVLDQGYTDLSFTQELNNLETIVGASSGLSADLHSRASFTFYSEDPTGNFSAFFTENNDFLQLGLDTLCISDAMLDVAFQITDSANYHGHCSDAGTIELYFPFAPGSVIGWGVSAWTYDANRKQLEIQFFQKAYFSVHKDIIAGSALEKNEFSLLLYPNPGSEKLFVGFENQRKKIEHVKIVDLQGKVLKEIGAARLQSNQGWINASGLASGIYILQVLSENRWYNQKWIKR